MTFITKQGSRVCKLAQNGLAAFGKGMQIISGSPNAETEQLSRLTSPSSTLVTSMSSALPPKSKLSNLRNYFYRDDVTIQILTGTC